MNNLYSQQIHLDAINKIFLLKESNSCHKKSIHVTGNQFLLQEINFIQKNLLSLVMLALSPCSIA